MISEDIESRKQEKAKQQTDVLARIELFLALYPLAHHPEGCGLFPGVRTAT